MGSKPQAVPSGLVLRPGSGGSRDRPGGREKTKSTPFSPSQQTSGLLSRDKNLIFKDKNEEEFRRNFGQ